MKTCSNREPKYKYEPENVPYMSSLYIWHLVTFGICFIVNAVFYISLQISQYSPWHTPGSICLTSYQTPSHLYSFSGEIKSPSERGRGRDSQRETLRTSEAESRRVQGGWPHSIRYWFARLGSQQDSDAGTLQLKAPSWGADVNKINSNHLIFSAMFQKGE